MWREGAGQPVPKFPILTMMLDADDKQLALCGGEKHVFGAKKMAWAVTAQAMSV